MPNFPTTSLLISTYNSPRALELSLLSINEQSVLPSEVIIADDGSTEETAQLIIKYRQLLPMPLIHVWHEDIGFRKTIIMNKSIAKSTGDYIIQIDGDIVMHSSFIFDHINNAEPRGFIVGSRVLLSRSRSEYLKETKELKLNMLKSGVSNRLNALRLSFLQRFFFDHRSENHFYGKGCNMSYWRKHFMEINGYNEEYVGWGLEDTDLIARFMQLGLNKKTVKFGAIAYHLYHKFSSRGEFDENKKRLLKVIRQGDMHAARGVDQYLKSH